MDGFARLHNQIWVDNTVYLSASSHKDHSPIFQYGFENEL